MKVCKGYIQSHEDSLHTHHIDVPVGRDEPAVCPPNVQLDHWRGHMNAQASHPCLVTANGMTDEVYLIVRREHGFNHRSSQDGDFRVGDLPTLTKQVVVTIVRHKVPIAVAFVIDIDQMVTFYRSASIFSQGLCRSHSYPDFQVLTMVHLVLFQIDTEYGHVRSWVGDICDQSVQGLRRFTILFHLGGFGLGGWSVE